MRREKKKGSRSIIVVIFLGILCLGPDPLQAAAPKGVLRQALHAALSADWLDPATNGGLGVSTNLPLYLLHDALIKAMPEGLYTPCLAESWSISPDSKVYEFKLRRGVKFHNGDTMTAEDVVFSFNRYKSTQAKFIHGKTEKIEIINPYLVRIHFKEAFPDFPEYMAPGVSAIGWVVPKKYLER